MNRIPITEPSRPGTLLAVAKADRASKGLERDVYEPLMKKRTANDGPSPTGLIASNTFETGGGTCWRRGECVVTRPKLTPVSSFGKRRTGRRRRI